jgi:hypothetical protein
MKAIKVRVPQKAMKWMTAEARAQKMTAQELICEILRASLSQ